MNTIRPGTALPEHVDVLVVGAGISGVSMACHLKSMQPARTFAIVDARDNIGGTWDLHRYPGIRSDADLHTFGFGFKPWTRDNAIADAHEILDYLNETIDDYGVRRHLHTGVKVVRAEFSTADARWVVTLRRASTGAEVQISCEFLYCAAGYYDYDEGYTPHFEGRDEFWGAIVHPQHWPEDLDYADKRVVVIGSGATAITLIPALAQSAKRVTMLQRSPSYVLPIPRKDPIANALRHLGVMGYRITRAININRLRLIYHASRRFPSQVRALVKRISARSLPDGFALDPHFTPTYAPWDQRMCFAPDGDFFQAFADGAAQVVTDTITRFTQSGILLDSGTELEADIIVTATGLNMVPFGKIQLSVDGEAVTASDRVVYKGAMLSDVPNFAFVIGYVNQSWTLKADLISDYICRVLAHMDQHGFNTCTPVPDNRNVELKPYIDDMNSGYLQRAMSSLPKQGTHGSWAVNQSYHVDKKVLADIEDPELVMRRAVARPKVPATRRPSRSTETAR